MNRSSQGVWYQTDYDVVVVGAGAGGMLAAIRCHDLGLRPIVIEKSHAYGGTSALSGAHFWIPCNHLMEPGDSRERALGYLRAIMGAAHVDERIEVYLDRGPEMARYVETVGIKLDAAIGFPDYFSEAPGALGGRSLVPANIDAARLGDDLHRLRELPPVWKLFNRYAMDTGDVGIFGTRRPGWKRAFARIVARYWLDLPWRLKTRRDRRLTLGNALIAGLRIAMRERGIPLETNLGLVRLVRDASGVSGLIVSRNGEERLLPARRGVILAAGGFEHDQAMRDAHHEAPTLVTASLTPGDNVGDAIRAGQAIDGDTESLEHGWWMPTIGVPVDEAPNTLTSHPLFRMPHSVCVNRLGMRFVDEAASYDRFGAAMIEDYRQTGANAPCWMIFDATFRAKYACGPLMPSIVTPDRRVPSAWWDACLYRAASVGELAAKIGLDPDTLIGVITRMNGYAASGVDPEFGRGDTPYDRVVSGDPAVQPNPCLGAIDKAPYYAVRVELGDIGTKGGLRTDSAARVLARNGQPIAGLYAIGNTAGSIFRGAYPGPGATLGPAMTFGYVAAADIARRPEPQRGAATDVASSSALPRALASSG